MKLARIGAVIVATLLLSTVARADQITSFGQLGTANVFFAVDNGDGTTTLSSSTDVNITNIILGPLDPMALFTLDAISIGDASEFTGPGGGTGLFQEFEGTFSLTNQLGTFNYLSGTFGGALLVGGDGGTGAVFTANTTTFDPLVLFTDLNIILQSPESFALAFSNITPGLAINGLGGENATLASFSASFTGTADAELQQVPVPEPATLTMLGMGLVGIAGAARRRLNRS